MRNLIQFILRYKDFFLFLTLQVLALYLLFSANVYHGTVAHTVARDYVAGMQQMRSSMREYFQLRQDNQELARQNQILLNRQRNSYRRVDNEYMIVDDTLMLIQYRYVPAQVINSSITKQKNYLTLNRGKLDGINPTMGVVTEQGVVGIVRNASRHFATVIPIINVSFELSVQTKRGNHFGLVRWDGKDPGYAFVEDMAKHADVKVGDSIVTRGASAIFPPGLLVGTIDEVEDIPGSNFHQIRMKLAQPYRNMNHVYVIQNALRQEQLDLEQTP